MNNFCRDLLRESTNELAKALAARIRLTRSLTREVAPRPSLTAGRNVFTYSGETVTGIPGGAAPNLLNKSHTITAEAV